jgi:hypothetical protein
MADAATLRVFVSYSHKDRALKEKLLEQLQPLVRFAGVDAWTDDRIRPGDAWRAEIDAALAQADVVLLLVSPSFLASTFIMDEEVPRAFERRTRDGVRVISVLLRACHWQAHPVIGRYQMLPQEAVPVAKFSGNKRDEVLAKVAAEIARLAKERAVIEPKASEVPASTEMFLPTRDALARLLAECFTRDELESFLAADPRLAPVLASLPPGLRDKREIASLAADALLRQGLVDAAFFERLLRVRSYLSQDIAPVRALCAGAVQAGSVPARAPAPAAVEPPAPSLRFITWRALGASLWLDRSSQWLKVLSKCKDHAHALFLLYGHSRQSLGLFLDRIRYYLASESGRPHRVVSVPFRQGHGFATTGDEWAVRLSAAIAPGVPGRAADKLASAARHEAVLIIFGLRPLAVDTLTPAQREGLRELLCTTLPGLLEEARPANPVRAVLAVDSKAEADPWFESLDTWGRGAEASGRLAYAKLPEVRFPPWHEVRDYVEDFKPRPGPEVVAHIEREYNALVAADDSTFQQLAEQLDRALGDA